MEAIRLEIPHAGLLDGYVAALRTGWSPSNVSDLSGPHLAAIEADAAGFLASYVWRLGDLLTLEDGLQVPKLPGQVYWITDGAFCGVINTRYEPGTEALPEHVSGHVGYAVVPWKRGRGVASAAMRALLPILADLGLERVLITADPDNMASRRVIEGVGGVLDPALPHLDRFGPRVGYWVTVRDRAS